MKKYMLFTPLICLMLMSSTCNNEKDHHFYVTLINQSDNDVYLCRRATNFDGQHTKCTIHRLGIIEKKSFIEYQPFKSSLEKRIGGTQVLELYFVNPNHYNEHMVFYDCDSVSIKNDILKHYRLTLEGLQQSNFTVTYP